MKKFIYFPLLIGIISILCLVPVFADTFNIEADQQEHTVEVSNTPQSAPIKIQKVDRETGKPVPLGAATLENAVFKLDYSDGANTQRTWYICTNDKGVATLNEDSLADGRVLKDQEGKMVTFPKSDKLYKNSKGEVVSPLGTVTITEVLAPKGYTNNNGKIVLTIGWDGKQATEETTSNVTAQITPHNGEGFVANWELVKHDTSGIEVKVEDQVMRGDIEFVKNKEKDSFAYPNVPFVIRSATTGEFHVVTTNTQGIASTTSFKRPFPLHSTNTNANDIVVNEKGEPIFGEDGFVDNSKTTFKNGIWFYKDKEGNEAKEVNDDLGALPYDTYYATELLVPIVKDRELIVDREFNIIKDNTSTDTHDHYIEFLGTWINTEPDPTYELFKTRVEEAPANEYGDGYGFKVGDKVTYNVYVSNNTKASPDEKVDNSLTLDVSDTFTEGAEFFSLPEVKEVKDAKQNSISADKNTVNITVAPETTATVVYEVTVLEGAKEYLANEAKDSDSLDADGKDCNVEKQANTPDDKDGYVNEAEGKNAWVRDKYLKDQKDPANTPVQEKPSYEMYKVRNEDALEGKDGKFGFVYGDMVTYNVVIKNTSTSASLTMDVTDQFTENPEYFSTPIVKEVQNADVVGFETLPADNPANPTVDPTQPANPSNPDPNVDLNAGKTKELVVGKDIEAGYYKLTSNIPAGEGAGYWAVFFNKDGSVATEKDTDHIVANGLFTKNGETDTIRVENNMLLELSNSAESSVSYEKVTATDADITSSQMKSFYESHWDNTTNKYKENAPVAMAEADQTPATDAQPTDAQPTTSKEPTPQVDKQVKVTDLKDKNANKVKITVKAGETAIVVYEAEVLDGAKEYMANAAKDSDSLDANGNDTNKVNQANETDDKDGYRNIAKVDNVIPHRPEPPKPETPVYPNGKEVLISKATVDSEELPGAHMVLTDKEGNVVDVWISEATPHMVKLDAGDYFLQETVAPEGFVVVTKFGFTVDAEGKVTTTSTEAKCDGGHLTVVDHAGDSKKLDPQEDEAQTPVQEPSYEMYKVRNEEATEKNGKFGFGHGDKITYNVVIKNTSVKLSLIMDVTDQFVDSPEYFSTPVVKEVQNATENSRSEDGNKVNITVKPGETAVVVYEVEVLNNAKEYLADEAKDSDSLDADGKDCNRESQANTPNDNDGYKNEATVDNVTPNNPDNPDKPHTPIEPKKDDAQTPVKETVIKVTVAKADKEKVKYYLKGAEITIFDEEGNVVKDIDGNKCVGKTDENGLVSFNVNFTSETKYYAQETKAPKGYELNKDKFELEQMDDDTFKTNIDIKILDEAIVIPPIKTGDDTNMTLYAILLLVALSAVGTTVYVRRRKITNNN